MIHTIDLQFLNTPTSIAAFVLETSAGLVLFETGPHSTYANLRQSIYQLGYNPDTIEHVFITHIHLDHAGAAWAFAQQGATIYVHPKGYSHLIDPSKLYRSAKRIYQDKMEYLWGELKPIPAAQLQVVKHGEIIQIGDTSIQGWFTPGHAVHHIAWQIGKNLIAGDVAGVKIEEGIVVPPCPPPDINVEDWEKSIQLMQTLDLEALYLTHFGKVSAVKTHLEALQKVLWNWANWIKPYWESNKSVEETTPLFIEYVEQQLKTAGINELGIRQYEAANPSWMSVAGLMRYWKKQAE